MCERKKINKQQQNKKIKKNTGRRCYPRRRDEKKMITEISGCLSTENQSLTASQNETNPS